MIAETVLLKKKTAEDLEKDAALVKAIFNSDKDKKIMQVVLDVFGIEVNK